MTRLAPANLNFLNTLGMAFYRQGELSTAIEMLKITLRGSSQPAFDLYILALCYQALGDAALAADFASRAEYLLETQEKSLGRQQLDELLQFRREFHRPLVPGNQ